MTKTPFTDKHASPWVPEPNTDWVPAYMVRELEREFNAAKAEVERLRDLLEAAYGLCQGYNWNNGTHSKTHGYKRKVLEAVHALKPVPDIEGKRHSFGGAALAPAPEEAVIKESLTTEPAPEWRELGPDEVIQEGDEEPKTYGWGAVLESYIGQKVKGRIYAVRTRRPLPKQEEMPLEDEIVRLQEVGRLNYAEGQQDLTDCLRYLRDEIEQLKKNQK